MSANAIITVNKLSKCYHIYDEPRWRLLQMLVGRRRRLYREFWALKDISFEIRPGETVGIIGRNGSGKSTLLQVVCGTLSPTVGNVKTSGRVAALLELGSGFNPEFSGRENVYLNAALLGLQPTEIDSCYEKIVAFAGIGDFIDQPVKTYSSGMVVRLAFAVQVQVKPDILIVDEALAVGDEAFQRKCYMRLQDMKADGVSILFVSHDAGTVVQLCDRVVLLEGGRKLAEGAPKPVVALYQKLIFATPEAARYIVAEIGNDHDGVLSDGMKEVPADDSFDPDLVPVSTFDYEARGALIEGCKVTDDSDLQVNLLNQGQTYVLRYCVTFTEAVQNVVFGMMSKTVTGVEVGGAATDIPGRGIPMTQAGARYRVAIRFRCQLNPGTYFLNAGVMGTVSGELTYLARRVDAILIRVRTNEAIRATGLVNLDVEPFAEMIA